MALIELHFYSKALKQATSVNVILPEIRKKEEGVGRPEGTYKTLYLFHGLTDDHTSWMRKTSIERYANEYGIAVVMPEVRRSWYTDTAYGEKYLTFVSEELPAVCRSYFAGMSDKREDNYVAGLSMGGYGAMKVALTHPESFCGCASLSGSLDITRKNRPQNPEEWKALFGYDLKDFDELCDTEHDLYGLVKKNHAAGVPFPKLFLWCGTEDHLLAINQQMRDLLEELNIEHCYRESEGTHSWKWWDPRIQDALKFLFGE